MAIELRFYRERYRTDPDYYLGDDDIYLRLYFRSLDELTENWDALMNANNHWLEGETYSAWDENGNILCGGAFDPDDINYIKEEYKEDRT